MALPSNRARLRTAGTITYWAGRQSRSRFRTNAGSAWESHSYQNRVVRQVGEASFPRQEFGDRPAFRQDGDRPSRSIREADLFGGDPQVLVEGSEDVAHADLTLGNLASLLVGGADNPSRQHAAASEQQRRGSRPMIAARLLHAGGAVGLVIDARHATELAGHHDQNAAIQAAFIQVFDQRRCRAVEILAALLHRLENVGIDRVIVPVTDAAAQFSVERDGHQIDASLDESPGQQAALAPDVAAIAFAQARVFLANIERPCHGWLRQHVPGLLLKGIEFALPAPLIGLMGQPIEALLEAHSDVQTLDIERGLKADVRHLKTRTIWIAQNMECRMPRAEVSWADVGNRIERDVSRQEANR